MKNLLRRNYQRQIKKIGKRTPSKNVQPQTSIVFAPHQDDETLGCGGTIINRIDAGCDIFIVFMTDGRNSHAHLMPATTLNNIRKQEALAASSMLGVTADKVLFLNFEDGRLNENQAAAVAKVSTILQKYDPDEVFIPHYLEPPLDHYATNRIVLTAINNMNCNPIIYAYPIWLWHHWPWVSLRQHTPPGTRAVVHNSLTTVFGLRFLYQFRCAFWIGNVLEQKVVALNQHRSQMTQLIQNSDWLTLHDVANGEFLACFFQDYELFHRYQ